MVLAPFLIQQLLGAFGDGGASELKVMDTKVVYIGTRKDHRRNAGKNKLRIRKTCNKMNWKKRVGKSPGPVNVEEEGAFLICDPFGLPGTTTAGRRAAIVSPRCRGEAARVGASGHGRWADALLLGPHDVYNGAPRLPLFLFAAGMIFGQLIKKWTTAAQIMGLHFSLPI